MRKNNKTGKQEKQGDKDKVWGTRRYRTTRSTIRRSTRCTAHNKKRRERTNVKRRKEPTKKKYMTAENEHLKDKTKSRTKELQSEMRTSGAGRYDTEACPNAWKRH